MLVEQTAWKRHGVFFDDFKNLERWVDRGAYVHFGDINKLGVNPQFHYTHPLGIYGYPLTHDFYEKIVGNRVPFAGHRKYIQVFKARIPSNVIMSDNYPDEALAEHMADLRKHWMLSREQVQQAMNKGKNNLERLFAATKFAARGNPLKQGLVLRKLSIDGTVDFDRNIAAFYGKDTIVHVDMVLNPKAGLSQAGAVAY